MVVVELIRMSQLCDATQMADLSFRNHCAVEYSSESVFLWGVRTYVRTYITQYPKWRSTLLDSCRRKYLSSSSFNACYL